MQSKPLRIGTRGSPLALAQAHETRQRLMRAHGLSEDEIEIEVISTKGDRVLDRALSEIGGKGLFTEEIEAKLTNGEIDLAVHSTKDMPTILPDGLYLSAYLPREDVRDAVIGKAAHDILSLPENSIVGSSSLRRQALIKRMRPDLQVITFRGNVQTRLKKLEAGEVGATLLAYAGLNRLGMSEIATDVLSVDDFPPAPGQGAICIESRVGDEKTDRLLAAINHSATEVCITCERAFLAALDGSCKTPIAGLARIDGEHIHFSGMILTPDGRTVYKAGGEGKDVDAAMIGRHAGEYLRNQAGSQFFESWK